MAGLGVLRPVLAPARALRGAARIVFPQWERARGAGGGWGRGRTKAPGLQRQGLAAQAGCGRGAGSGLAIVFSLAFRRTPYYLFLFPLFYFYLQVAGRTGCRPFTPLPWSAARRRPEPAQAKHHSPPGRRRLPGRAQPGAGQGWGTAGEQGRDGDGGGG